ncbi:MAG: ribonuclease [Oscillospiraceae bacterium]|nr:ribonuclease [Oscillospiraceae bacterium]
MLKIREAIVVEGKYDKNTLSQLVDTVIVQTDGFGIFNDREQLALLRRLAERRGLIILTDSDGAGFLIRNHLKGSISPDRVKHAYIPDIMGKERRKRTAGKEGKLGVEGMSPAILEEALRRAGATFEEELPPEASPHAPITKADLFALGLSGRPDSAARRAVLQKKLKLPARMSPNALLQALNALYSIEDIRHMLEE